MAKMVNLMYFVRLTDHLLNSRVKKFVLLCPNKFISISKDSGKVMHRSTYLK